MHAVVEAQMYVSMKEPEGEWPERHPSIHSGHPSIHCPSIQETFTEHLLCSSHRRYLNKIDFELYQLMNYIVWQHGNSVIRPPTVTLKVQRQIMIAAIL